MSDYIAKHKEFGFTAEVTSDDMTVGNMRIHTTDVVEAVIRRPDKLWIDTEGDVFEKRFF